MFQIIADLYGEYEIVCETDDFADFVYQAIGHSQGSGKDVFLYVNSRHWTEPPFCITRESSRFWDTLGDYLGRQIFCTSRIATGSA